MRQLARTRGKTGKASGMGFYICADVGNWKKPSVEDEGEFFFFF